MNAKEELIKTIDVNFIKCARIQKEEEYDYELGGYLPLDAIELKVNHTYGELHQFLELLNFNYNNGYGGQELFGNVWMNDGTWLERGEYNGSEWWEHKICPTIPNELL